MKNLTSINLLSINLSSINLSSISIKNYIAYIVVFVLLSHFSFSIHSGGADNTGPSAPRQIIEEAHRGVSKILEGKDVMNDNDRAKMLKLIESHTDFETMAKRVVEPFKKQQNAAQQKEFAQTFKELMQSSSVRKLGKYRATRFDYLGEEIHDGQTIVKTLAYYKDETLHMDYVFETVGDSPKVVDYVVEDVATVRNYRKQFRRLFQKKSFEAVMEQLRKKIRQYREEESAQRASKDTGNRSNS
jgi:phospholipid transport system substrate-binding protein